MSARDNSSLVSEQHIVFQGEVQLLRWSDTSTQGATVTFQLADRADLERFKDLTLAKKGQVGQRLATVMVEIGSDELPVEQPAPPCAYCGSKDGSHDLGYPHPSAMGLGRAAPVESELKPGMLCIMACTFCADPIFRQWVSAFHGPCDTEAEAKLFVLKTCDVLSRKDLDKSTRASGRFHANIREPYITWRAQP